MSFYGNRVAIVNDERMRNRDETFISQYQLPNYHSESYNSHEQDFAIQVHMKAELKGDNVHPLVEKDVAYDKNAIIKLGPNEARNS